MDKNIAKRKEVARFSPKLDMGLGYSQVEQRAREHKTNARILNPAKSALKIIAENVFSFCNIITLVLIVLLFVIVRRQS